MNPYLQAMLMRAAQRGDDQVVRSGMPGAMSVHQLGAMADPGIYGSGGGMPGGVAPVMPRTSSDPGYRQLGLAQNVMQGLQQGQDVNLTGSGFELSPQQLMGGGGPQTSLDMLQQYLRPPGVFGAMNTLGGFGQ